MTMQKHMRQSMMSERSCAQATSYCALTDAARAVSVFPLLLAVRICLLACPES